jgi:hypothetical protein
VGHCRMVSKKCICDECSVSECNEIAEETFELCLCIKCGAIDCQKVRG